jgi:hypothetical protein
VYGNEEEGARQGTWYAAGANFMETIPVLNDSRGVELLGKKGERGGAIICREED